MSKLLIGFVLMASLPFVELYLLVKVGQQIGAWNVVALVIFMGVIGVMMARQQGRSLLRTMQEKLQRGELPGDTLLQGLLIFLGGLLLIVPGLISDVFGLILVFPPTRQLLAKGLSRYLLQQMRSGRFRVQVAHMDPHAGSWSPPGPQKWRDVNMDNPPDAPLIADVIDLNSVRRDREPKDSE